MKIGSLGVLFGVLLLAATAAGCSGGGESSGSGASSGAGASSGSGPLKVSSLAFGEGAAIPMKHVCAGQGGKDISPGLAWSGVPAEARELAIVVDDPDAPGGSYIHWMLTGVPVSPASLPEGGTAGKAAPGSDGRPAYAGPCPPSGVHHYHFIVYALREPVQVSGGDAAAVHAKLKSAAIARGETVGTWGT